MFVDLCNGLVSAGMLYIQYTHIYVFCHACMLQHVVQQKSMLSMCP